MKSRKASRITPERRKVAAGQVILRLISVLRFILIRKLADEGPFRYGLSPGVIAERLGISMDMVRQALNWSSPRFSSRKLKAVTESKVKCENCRKSGARNYLGTNLCGSCVILLRRRGFLHPGGTATYEVLGIELDGELKYFLIGIVAYHDFLEEFWTDGHQYPRRTAVPTLRERVTHGDYDLLPRPPKVT